jgi:tripartite ATP-independent transporter DctP family solute receptor
MSRACGALIRATIRPQRRSEAGQRGRNRSRSGLERWCNAKLAVAAGEERMANWLKGTALATDFGMPTRHAAEFAFNWGTNVPRAHPLNVHAQRAADAIREATNGRFDLRLFPNNELGGDSRMFSQLRAGEIECFTLSGVNVLSGLVPDAAIHGLGFAFPNYDAVWKALDGKLGLHLRTQIEKSGLVVMEKIWDNGFRQITTSTRPILRPMDLAGLRLRVPISAMWTSLFQSLGAAPGGIDFASVYSALETKIFDGQENPLAIISTARLYEVQTYCSITNHMWDGWWFLVNRRAWERLPSDIRDVVTKHLNSAAVEQRRDLPSLNVHFREDLVAKGLVFNEVDPAPFQEKLRQAGFYAQWRSKFGEEAWSLLEEATGRLA